MHSCIDQSLVEAKEDGVTPLWITNNGKTTYQLQTGVELAEACEVDLELDNEVTATPEETLCEVHEKLGESSPIANSTETDTSIPITDDLIKAMDSEFIDKWQHFFQRTHYMVAATVD